MARRSLVSLRQLERFFADHFHKSPRTWAREVRFQIACQLISKGLPNKTVVAELGFGNEAHLCHEFKKLHGVMPKALNYDTPATMYSTNEFVQDLAAYRAACRLQPPDLGDRFGWPLARGMSLPRSFAAG